MKHTAIKSALMRLMAVFLLSMGTATASAQYYMNVVKKGGDTIQYPVSDIEYVIITDQKINEYVDLGLSVKWATCNVGAEKPEDFGDYFAWGETEPKTDYSWSTYKWCNGSASTLNKYCRFSEYGNEGFTDTLMVLSPEDDVAHVKWGGCWRMPTMLEQDELLNNCTWTWYGSGNSEFNGVAGYKVTSNIEGYTDRSIFLPAAGYRRGERLDLTEEGYYWSSWVFPGSPATGGPFFAVSLEFYSDSYYTHRDYRNYGFTVRPVCP